MNLVQTHTEIIDDAPIKTWFGAGGNADRLCRPADAASAAWCVQRFEGIRVLGDGANLLVADRGVDGLVLDLSQLNEVSIDNDTGFVRAGAGANLPKLILQTVRKGLGGLETLAGIPASVGGAAIMNAGGRFGEFGDTVSAVEIINDHGEIVRLIRSEIEFGYRHSGLAGVVIAVEFALIPDDPAEVRDRLKSCMAYKKTSQPLGAHSAGCCFRNPMLTEEIDGIGQPGDRVSAGMLLDKAGCKNMRIGNAVVSDEHANFLISEKGATASDLRALMSAAARRVEDHFGVQLNREVVIWDRDSGASR